jgi:hypothetical protein
MAAPWDISRLNVKKWPLYGNYNVNSIRRGWNVKIGLIGAGKERYMVTVGRKY